MPAASTVKMLQLCNTNGQSIYLATTSNWTSVQSKLRNYGTVNNGDTWLVANHYYLLATNGATLLAGPGSYKQAGYVKMNASVGERVMGMLIGTNLPAFGGEAAWPVPISPPWVATYSAAELGQILSGRAVSLGANYNADPVNMADASFRVAETDLSLGQKEPLGMTFTRFYSSTRRSLN